MRTRALLRGAWLAAGLLLAAAGCGSGPAPLAAVRGKVLYRGAPLAAGTIVFTPDTARGCRGEIAFADIRPDGTYDLMTGASYGAAPGWHRITVCALLPATATPPGQPPALPVSLLPPRYRDPRISGLACEVKADQLNRIDFQLD
jgi:hypothetical protein